MDNDKLTEYVGRFQATVYRVAYSYVKSPADAEDITQEVFLKLYRAEDKFVSDENVKAWLIRVTINMSKNFLSSFWRRRKSDLPESITLKGKTDYVLLEALNRLNKNYRIAIYLHYYEGYSVSEISSILKISESNVKARLKRGRDKLKAFLTDDM